LRERDSEVSEHGYLKNWREKIRRRASIYQQPKMPMDTADHSLLTRVLDEHGPALVLYAQQWCATPEDIVQEAFIRLMQQRPLPDNIGGWLYRVVRNGAISASRATARRVRHETGSASRREPWFKPALEDVIDANTATAALQALAIDEREVVVLRIWGGRSFEEIAELIGKSSSTAHRRFEAGLESLRAACLSRQRNSQ
jgi:RNA polymerase sigma factor (sigma-70 family)